ncbi:MAG: type I DNA topoisomerase [bacterium]
MAKKMIIVESKAKTQSIGKILGSDYKVTYCLGHIYDLPTKELGIDVERGFKPQYVVVSGKSKLVKQLQEQAQEVDTVVLATDPDREGESIAWHLARLFKSKKIQRMTFNEITSKAVKEAINNLREIDMNLVDAQQARRVLDRLVGYKLSPLLWRTLNNSKLSAGRVQSVALRLICDREREVEGFVPQEYWNITGYFERIAGAHESLKAAFIGNMDEEIKIENEQQATELIAALEKCKYAVYDVKRKTEARRPLAPFTTSTLQQEASRRINFSTAKTMAVAQQLYEGIELGSEGAVGLITYMRTDSVRISDDAKLEAAALIKEKFGANYLPEKPNFYKSKANVQDAHEAIRPSYVTREPGTVVSFLSKDQYRLYELIWNRFVASQMAPAAIDTTRYDVAGDNRYMFRATGSKTAFDGFLKVYALKVKEDTENETEAEEENQLPMLEKNEGLDLKKIDPAQKFTKPPSRYTEASLVRELEEKGIGRPSTYVPIIETLKKRDYTRLEKKSFRPTKTGMVVNDLLKGNFPAVVDFNFTAKMEDELDQVETGAKDWVKLISDFYSTFKVDLEKAAKTMKFEEKSDEICPECGAGMVVKPGKFGLFLGCSKYPTCKFTKPYETGPDGAAAAERAKPLPSDEKCDKCGSDMVIRTGRYGKFLACSAYPKCRNIKPITGDFKCPREGCEGKVIPRRSKARRTFYGCSAYPKCTFVSWYPPVENETCPDCGSILIMEKKKSGTTKKCAREECGKIIPVVEEEAAAEE